MIEDKQYIMLEFNKMLRDAIEMINAMADKREFSKPLAPNADEHSFERVLSADKIRRTFFPEIALSFCAAEMIMQDARAVLSDIQAFVEGRYNESFYSSAAAVLTRLKHFTASYHLLYKLLGGYEKRSSHSLSFLGEAKGRFIKDMIAEYESAMLYAAGEAVGMRYDCGIEIFDELSFAYAAELINADMEGAAAGLEEYKLSIFSFMKSRSTIEIEEELKRRREEYRLIEKEMDEGMNLEAEKSVLADYMNVLFMLSSMYGHVSFTEFRESVKPFNLKENLPLKMKSAVYQNFFGCLSDYFRMSADIKTGAAYGPGRSRILNAGERSYSVPLNYVSANLSAYAFFLNISMNSSVFDEYIGYYLKILRNMSRVGKNGNPNKKKL